MNNKKILYFIVAKSGCGKDYVLNKICDKFDKKKVISATTRKQREGEKDTHRFVSNELADKEFGQALGKTIFDKERYYTTIEDLAGRTFYVIDQKGIETFEYSRLKEELDTEVLVIYVKSRWYVRAWHMLKRGDSIKSIIRRLKHDKSNYDDEYLEGISAKVLNGSNELYEYFEDKFTK